MDTLTLILRLHEHRAWVDRQLLDAVGKLTDDELKRTFSIGQGSVWKSLLHMYAAEYVWLECLRGHEQSLLPGDRPDMLPGNQAAEGGVQSLAALDESWQKLAARWQEYLERLPPDALDEIVAKVSSNGKRTTTRTSDVLLHVCTHAHYTTAQVVNILRQLGAQSLPEVMLIALARQQMAAS